MNMHARSFVRSFVSLTTFASLASVASLAAFTACSSANTESQNGSPAGSGPAASHDASTGGGSSLADGGSSQGSGSSGPTNGSGASDAGPELFLWSTKIYTGVDGQHEFVVPTATVLVQDTDTSSNAVPFTEPPTFTLDDPSLATIKIVPAPNLPDLQQDPILKASTFAIITPTKAGQTVLNVAYKSQSVKAGLTVSAYTPQQYTLGQTRYTNPDNPGAKRLACTTCHAAGSDAGLDAPRHDPFLQQDLSDEELLVIIEKGQYDANDPNSALKVPGGHAWNLTADEEKAIPVYLRSLRPLGF